MKLKAEIKKQYDCDVLVIGGGVAGFGAAVAAAREGAKVILTEENGYLGGTATAGLVAPFMTCYDTKGEKQIIHGVFEELVEELVKVNGAVSPADCRKCDSHSGYRLRGHFGTTPFDKEQLKIVMENMCLKAGVELKYHYLFVQAKKKGRKMTSAIFATGDGFRQIHAKAFIDCTGNAAVVHSAGGATVYAYDEGVLQPVSTFFLIDNVDKEALDKACLSTQDNRERFFMDIIEKARSSGEFNCGTQKVRMFEQPNGIWAVNMCQIDEPFDVNEPDLITKAEIEGRKQAQEIFHFLKKYIPGLENIRMLQTSERVGVRESRRIVGEYTLTYDDLLASRVFDDAIVYLSNSSDVHGTDSVNYQTFKNEKPYTVPYRCLVHRDFDNVWSPGKSVSADRKAHGAIRVIPPSIAMGEAAGVASAIAVREKLPAKDVPVNLVQAKVLK